MIPCSQSCKSVDAILSVTIQMNDNLRNFPVVLFIVLHTEVLTGLSVYEFPYSATIKLKLKKFKF